MAVSRRLAGSLGAHHPAARASAGATWPVFCSDLAAAILGLQRHESASMMPRTRPAYNPPIEEAMQDFDLVVVGAGVAGLTAATFAARHGLKVAVVERTGAGGQIVNADSIENFPGFPRGIAGHELGPLLHEQAEAAGAEFGLDTVEAIELMGARGARDGGSDPAARPRARSGFRARRNSEAGACRTAPRATGLCSPGRKSASSAAATRRSTRRWCSPVTLPASRSFTA